MYGELDNGNSAISQMIYDSLNNKKIILNNNRNILRDYIYISDLTDILRQLLKKQFIGILNIGSFKSRTIHEYAKLISKYTKAKIIIDKDISIQRSYDVKISGSKLHKLIEKKIVSIDANIIKMIKSKKNDLIK